MRSRKTVRRDCASYPLYAQPPCDCATGAADGTHSHSITLHAIAQRQRAAEGTRAAAWGQEARSHQEQCGRFGHDEREVGDEREVAARARSPVVRGGRWWRDRDADVRGHEARLSMRPRARSPAIVVASIAMPT